MKEKITKVLLTGSMRSGTTFLANYLNANKECAFMRDSFVAIFRTSWRLGIKSFTELLPTRLRNIVLVGLKAETVLMGIDKLNHLQNTQFTTLEELFDVSMELLIDDNTKVFGVKVTQTEYWFKTLLKETDIKVIYMIRDLRDILLSSANRFPDYDRVRYSNQWFKGVTEALKNSDNSRLIFIKFEDLILYPEKTFKLLSAFLGVKLDTNINEIKDVSEAVWTNNSAFHDVKKLFDPIAVNRWKNNFDSKEVEYGSAIYQKLMKTLGYEENKIPFFKGLKIRIGHNWFFFRLGRKTIRNAKRLFRKVIST